MSQNSGSVTCQWNTVIMLIITCVFDTCECHRWEMLSCSRPWTLEKGARTPSNLNGLDGSFIKSATIIKKTDSFFFLSESRLNVLKRPLSCTFLFLFYHVDRVVFDHKYIFFIGQPSLSVLPSFTLRGRFYCFYCKERKELLCAGGAANRLVQYQSKWVYHVMRAED